MPLATPYGAVLRPLLYLVVCRNQVENVNEALDVGERVFENSNGLERFHAIRLVELRPTLPVSFMWDCFLTMVPSHSAM